MKIYLVGGYVRDQLLKRPAHERDWVVVGADPQELVDQGYQPVGKSFPVFLHPKTHEEYALARIERKVSTGHTGFSCNSNKTVTLEQDLQRRDLTINAIAMNDQGTLIDPYHGQQDLQNRVLRHVSLAFIEDPLRVLRVARLRAQLAEFNFTVAPETIILMRKIVEAGELNTLSAERIWAELYKALLSPKPIYFFETLRACGADVVLFPQANSTALIHAMQLTPDPEIYFAALMYINPDQLKAPNVYHDLAQLTHRFHERADQALTLDADALLSLLLSTDSLRRPKRFEQLLVACQAIHTAEKIYPQAQLLLKLQKQLLVLDLSEITQQVMGNADKAKAIEQKRLVLINDYIIRIGSGA